MRNAGNGGYFEVYGFKQLKDASPALYGLNCFRIKEQQGFEKIQTPFSNPYGIQFNSVEDLFQEDNGTLWVATDNGLYFTSNIRKNIHIVFDQEKERASVTGLFEDAFENLWISTWGKGVFVLGRDRNMPQVKALEAVNGLDAYTRMAWTVCEDNKNHIWIGCDEGRLIEYNPQTKKSLLHRLKIVGNQAIRQIVKDTHGKLWLGLRDGKLLVLEPSKNMLYKELFTFNGAITRMGFINERYLWVVANNKGIYIVDVGTGTLVRSLTVDEGYTALIARAKEVLPVNDTLCLISGEKLGMLNPKTFKLTYGWLNDGNLLTLQKDNDNNCWMGGSNGIFKLNMLAKTLTKFTQRDGMITIHNNSYVPERSAKLKSGWLAFGGNQHIVVFNPKEYNNALVPPAVTITGLQLNGRYLPNDSLVGLKVIEVPYAHKSFSIEFAAVNFSQKNRLQYEYKLEGLDKDWTPSTSPLPVNYNFLPHGSYRFLVRARNELGRYSANITSLPLYIAPPFWKTGWFYAVIGLLVSILLFYLHRLRVQKLLHVEKVRSRLARDLHDDMGSTLSTINILSNMALQQESLDDAKNKNFMRTISDSTTQMMEALDDIVWSINPVNDSIARIVARMKETAGAILEPQQIDYIFNIAPSVTELHLPMEARREVYLIFKEAVNNIVKYARATRAVVDFKREGSHLLLTIEDNGIGFATTEPASAMRGNGLKNMQKRAAYLKGHLSISSAPGKGTLVSLTIPIA